MKQNEATTKATAECKSTTCLECALCSAVNFEEHRKVLQNHNNKPRSLYGAEAQTYAYYFLPLRHRAQAG